MSSSKLRQEYEARMGIVWGNFELFNAQGQEVYHEHHSGCWLKREYYEEGQEVYCENSNGTVRDNRPNKAKIFTDEKGTKYKVVEVLG